MILVVLLKTELPLLLLLLLLLFLPCPDEMATPKRTLCAFTTLLCFILLWEGLQSHLGPTVQLRLTGTLLSSSDPNDISSSCPPLATTTTPSDLVFVHIPKSAGTSMRNWLKRFFAPDDRSWFYPEGPTAGEAWLVESNQGKFAVGHAKAQRMLQGPRHNATVITVIRDPITRLQSFYYEQSRNNRLVGRSKDLSFTEWVQQKNQTAGHQYLFFGSTLEEAIEFIRHRVAVVGIFENMEETLWMVSQTLPYLQAGQAFPHHNVHQKKADYEAELIANLPLVMEKVQRDLIFYREAQKVFASQLQCIYQNSKRRRGGGG